MTNLRFLGDLSDHQDDRRAASCASRRAAAHWVTSAKARPDAAAGLAQLIEDSEAGRTVAPLTRPGWVTRR
jgi:hypothetical protein